MSENVVIHLIRHNLSASVAEPRVISATTVVRSLLHDPPHDVVFGRKVHENIMHVRITIMLISGPSPRALGVPCAALTAPINLPPLGAVSVVPGNRSDPFTLQ